MGLGGWGRVGVGGWVGVTFELPHLLPLLLLLHHREHLRRRGIKLAPAETVLPIGHLVSEDEGGGESEGEGGGEGLGPRLGQGEGEGEGEGLLCPAAHSGDELLRAQAGLGVVPVLLRQQREQLGLVLRLEGKEAGVTEDVVKPGRGGEA